MRDFQEATSVFNVKIVEGPKERALQEDSAIYETDKANLCGCCIFPGVCLKNKVNALFCADKYVSTMLTWPTFFGGQSIKKSACALCTQKNGSRRQHVFVPFGFISSYQKPTQARNNTVHFVNSELILNVLITSGFEENDTIQVRLKFWT